MNNEELKDEMNTEETPDIQSEAPGEEEAKAENSEAENSEAEGAGQDAESDRKESDRAESSEEDEALNTKYMRLMADFQNYKRRTEKENSDIYAYANEKIMTELLAVMDNFERALQIETADEGFAEGMKMIFKQMTDVLTKAGLEEIKAHGETFDPNFHNAVLMEDNADFESGKVTEVLQKGYILNGRVIRASMVKVNN